MNEEQKEKWYNSFTREQLIERCEYLQRSCERKENSIMELEMENGDLEKGYCELKEKCNNGECDCTNEEYNSMCEANIKLENEVERLKTKYVYKPKIKFREVLKLREEIERLNNVIKEVREYINHYETIRGYYEYQELGYDEYNYDDDLKKELLEILDKENI